MEATSARVAQPLSHNHPGWPGFTERSGACPLTSAHFDALSGMAGVSGAFLEWCSSPLDGLRVIRAVTVWIESAEAPDAGGSSQVGSALSKSICEYITVTIPMRKKATRGDNCRQAKASSERQAQLQQET
ncbi:hypothetical protein FIBSPDRAFT_886518 [Athelia psychrophila]|uniref:Uncharacterized protein n=1 Tax=Athelia psychrophila TaxID=1759441 RepID=A0A166QWR1_9AGAM|nr:hypothetical protein FIBSPDRAFT_886518 [Fibularhizoctonia sp. CBS 109695]